MSPMRCVGPLSFSRPLWTNSITRPSERAPWQWCDGLHSVRTDLHSGRHANTRSGINVHRHAFSHINTDNRTHAWAHNHGPGYVHARTRSSELPNLSTQGRSIWHSFPLESRPWEASRLDNIIHAHTSVQLSDEMPAAHSFFMPWLFLNLISSKTNSSVQFTTEHFWMEKADWAGISTAV